MRNARVYLLPSLIALAGGALVEAYAVYMGGRPLSADSAAALAMRMAQASKPSGERARRDWGPQALTPAFTDACWAQARATMRGAGASEQEADGVLRAARAKSREPHCSNRPVYAVPAVVRRGTTGPSDVWLFRLQWEVPEMAAHGGAIKLGHHWVLVIDAHPPHAVLGEISCG